MSERLSHSRSKRTPPPAVPDNVLLARARNGDRDAYHQLFLRHAAALEHFVAREIRYNEILGEVEPGWLDPRAILDQVYIAALDSLKHLPPRVTFRGWLRYLARRIIRQHARLEQAEAAANVRLEDPVSTQDNVDTELWEFYQTDDAITTEDVLPDGTATDPERWVELRELTREIENKINALPPHLREAFVLRVIEGLSLDEIAVLTGRDPQELRQAVHDARELLKGDLVPHE